MTLIVDGYNIIGAWPEFLKAMNLQECRDMLTDILCDYAGGTGDKVILVFDACYGKNPKQTVENEAGGVQVVYTRGGETADHYIERLVGQMRGARAHNDEVRVATSDRLEQTIVLGRGAARIPAMELRRVVLESKQRYHRAHKPPQKEPLSARLPGDVLEKLEEMRRRKE